MEHCGVNAVLYRRRGGRWVMTQIPRSKVQRGQEELRMSGSRIAREGTTIRISLDEQTAVWGQRVRGQVELNLEGGLEAPRALDRAGDHAWWPVGAIARASVKLETPGLSFSGSAYHDCNFGRVPLEQSFARWTWSRSEVQSGSGVAILYDTVEKSGESLQLGLHLDTKGVRLIEAPHQVSLGKGGWGMADETRSESLERPPKLVRRLEDTPFYNRSLIRSTLLGQDCVSVHESLSLDRFTQGWVQFLLPFRIRTLR